MQNYSRKFKLSHGDRKKISGYLRQTGRGMWRSEGGITFIVCCVLFKKSLLSQSQLIFSSVLFWNIVISDKLVMSAMVTELKY